MVKRMSSREARANFSEILGLVHFGKDTVIIEKQGKPVVAVVDIALYEEWMARRKARLKVFEEIWAKNKARDLKQVEKDVTRAIREVREMKRAKKALRA